jgi:hypothetical protein
VKINTDVKVTFNPKSKVCDINNHGERSVTGSQTLLYRPLRDVAKIMFISAIFGMQFKSTKRYHKLVLSNYIVTPLITIQPHIYLKIYILTSKIMFD